MTLLQRFGAFLRTSRGATAGAVVFVIIGVFDISNGKKTVGALIIGIAIGYWLWIVLRPALGRRR